MLTGEPCVPVNGNASCVLFTTAANASLEDFIYLQPTTAADDYRNGTVDVVESSFDSCLRVKNF